MSPKKQSRKIDWKKQREIDRYEMLDKRFYIFCEGEKTEPNYFEGIKKHIEKNPLYKNSVLVEVEGVGADTFKVLDYAMAYVEKNKVKNAEIWLVYDKDSFPAERFNGVVDKVSQLNNNQIDVTYFTAWSNQCIEYWFILHFDYYDSDNDRSCYINYLNDKFKALGCGKYEKNMPNIYDILKEKGRPELAVRYAQRRLSGFTGTPSVCAPATKVHELYTKLSRYLPKDEKP